VNIVYRRELAAAGGPERGRQQKIEEFRERFANPFVARSAGMWTTVIEPRETRPRVISLRYECWRTSGHDAAEKHGTYPYEMACVLVARRAGVRNHSRTTLPGGLGQTGTQILEGSRSCAERYQQSAGNETKAGERDQGGGWNANASRRASSRWIRTCQSRPRIKGAGTKRPILLMGHTTWSA